MSLRKARNVAVATGIKYVDVEKYRHHVMPYCPCGCKDVYKHVKACEDPEGRYGVAWTIERKSGIKGVANLLTAEIMVNGVCSERSPIVYLLILDTETM